MSHPIRVGAQCRPQHSAFAPMRDAWLRAEEAGLDALFTWDHFYPLFGPPDGEHFECWTLLGAMAEVTERPQIGALVTCNAYRNPELLADMARTVDHISGGRLVLGIGAGWFKRDFDEYGYRWMSGPERVQNLERALQRIRARLPKLSPPPVGPLPILVGGGGERVTLRLVAQYADMWNGFGPLEVWATKNAVLDEWCDKLGRDPATVERTAFLPDPAEIDRVDDYVSAGADHIILGSAAPFDLGPLHHLLELAEADAAG